jgi:hypothetical protein
MNKCVVSVCSYEGGLLGVSIGMENEKFNFKDITTEYSFTAVESSI